MFKTVHSKNYLQSHKKCQFQSPSYRCVQVIVPFGFVFIWLLYVPDLSLLVLCQTIGLWHKFFVPSCYVTQLNFVLDVGCS